MAEILNSKSFNEITEYAKKTGDPLDDSLTAEKFVIACIDAASGSLEHISEKESEAIKKVFETFTSQGLASVRSTLKKFVIKGNPDHYLSDYYLRKMIIKAKDIVRKHAKKELEPEVLLRCILAEPSERINSAVTAKKPLSAEEIKELDHQLITDYDFDDFDDEYTDIDDDYDSSLENFEENRRRESRKETARLISNTKQLRDKLLASVFGQENAISVLCNGMFQADSRFMNLENRGKPYATFLFAGPPGVGKTYLAQRFAEESGGIPFRRFDMSEYADKESYLEFSGSDKVYKNGKAGNVTSFVANNPSCILLFDEIEKAHLCIIHLFLQILDAGFLRDSFTDEEVSFERAIIIFTTNAGKKLYEESSTGDFSNVSRKVIINALKTDINPATNAPYFPAAICSRLASGNVVMFNHIQADSLINISKREIEKLTKSYKDNSGIEISMESDIYPALLFSEGGKVDARTMRSRSNAFISDEMFELMRLLPSEDESEVLEKLDKVSFSVDVGEKPEIVKLFKRTEPTEIMVFASDDMFKSCVCDGEKFFRASDTNEADTLICENDIKILLINPKEGLQDNSDLLNIEDVQSEGRTFLHYFTENYPEIPAYVIFDADSEPTHEEQISLSKYGVKGFICLNDEFADKIRTLCVGFHQQSAIINLARSNKILTYETSQRLVNDGSEAEIKMFDFRLETAVDSEDTDNIMSAMSMPDVRFGEVIGAESAKVELMHFAEQLRHPKKFARSGIKPPKGILLYGPPGTGKTMLAKAMAAESGVTFIATEGNRFLKPALGEGPEEIHKIFRTARKYAPTVLFIDEIEVIAKERRGGTGEDVMTALLTEMDGFAKDLSKPVFVLAATNFTVEPGSDRSLDSALLRRFNRRFFVDLPNGDNRKEYLIMKTNNRHFDVTEKTIDNLVVRSMGMSLAKLESVLELSLRTAIRQNSEKVTDSIITEAFEEFNGGEVKHWNEEDVKRTAVHEAGHTLIYWLSGETPSYVTIVSRGHYGGYMQHDSDEDKLGFTKDELLSKIRTSLGGRAAEMVCYNQKGISTGAASDLAHATRLAKRLICTYGMDDTFGLAVIEDSEAVSDTLAAEIRAKVNEILSSELENAIKLIKDNRKAFDAVTKALHKKNHLSGDEIKKILSK